MMNPDENVTEPQTELKINAPFKDEKHTLIQWLLQRKLKENQVPPTRSN